LLAAAGVVSFVGVFLAGSLILGPVRSSV